MIRSCKIKESNWECCNKNCLKGFKNWCCSLLVAKQWIADIRIQRTCVCWVQVNSWSRSWVVTSCSWGAVNIWKTVFVWQVICAHYSIVCLLIVCNLVSIIYFFKLTCILSCAIWTITIVIVNNICTTISRCALALWSTDWSSWAVRTIGACTYWWINCREVSLIWTVCRIINNSTVARILTICICICWWNEISWIWSRIIIRCCRISICTRNTKLWAQIVCS